jgi:hypothetical protein
MEVCLAFEEDRNRLVGAYRDHEATRERSLRSLDEAAASYWGPGGRGEAGATSVNV